MQGIETGYITVKKLLCKFFNHEKHYMAVALS